MQVADLIRKQRCSCPAEMVNTLLVLKLKDADPHSTSKGMQLLSSLDIAVETVLVLVLYLYCQPMFMHGTSTRSLYVM